MDESFLGHEATFSLPCDASVVPLLMGFIEELLMVGGSDVEAPEKVEEQLRGAVEKICGRGAPEGKSPKDSGSAARDEIRVTLSIVADGIEARFSSQHDGLDLPSILVREE